MTTTDAIFQSLLTSPLLVGDLPNAARFSRRDLVAPSDSVQLNFDQKLGHLYEDALAIVFASSPNIELLEQNLQIQENIHSTVGELDFLIRDANGTLTHLELATKFYLSVKTENGISFPGPDSRDNYDRKIQRLLSHQLILTERHKANLPPAYCDEDVVVKQLIYGCLFDHFSDHISQADLSVPKFSNPNCRRGRWLHHAELAEHFRNESQFHLIPKYLWPVPIKFLEKIPLEEWRPNMFADRCVMLRIEGHDCSYFVAPDEYPKQS
ncbi:DUF1853 family protein [bacterium]|nr:DUF1853 family protein [bacterium]